MRNDEISKKVSDLLDKYQIDKPVVNVFEIAEDEGINLKFVKMPEALKDVAGFFDAESKSIFINNEDSPNRQVFTVAHELGHYILGHNTGQYGVLYRRQILSIEQVPAEKEANYFAANLLVPKQMLKDIMEKYNLTKKDDEILASLFGVSREMMGYRIKNCCNGI